jgi:Spy/CpxP family protein refolding chaperone
MDQQTQDMVAAELKRFVADLNLTDAQKAQAKTAFENLSERADEYMKSGKTPTKEEVAAWRTNFRTKLEAFLTPEQLAKWDAEAAKAKTFFGQSV